MPRPHLLSLERCTDLSLVGGKAAGLARLSAAGVPVPAGYCATTAAYDEMLHAGGFSPSERWREALQRIGEPRRQYLSECRSMIRRLDVSPLVGALLEGLQRVPRSSETRWAVRSSATNEDAAQVSFAGIYRTELGVALGEIGPAITALWSSIWDERVMDYMGKAGTSAVPPAMAVVFQPMLDASVAGVAYSIHPVTGRNNQVAINAVRGLGAPLVDGSMTPDHYVVETGSDGQPRLVRRRILAHQRERLALGCAGLKKEPLAPAAQMEASLTDLQLFVITRLAKHIERVFRGPVDVEWAIDAERLWILQARPITGVQPSSDLTDGDCEWSRTNFKETMPDIPSPMGLALLEHFMDAYILSHYRRLGCRIPQGLSAVRTLYGRPYINMTLFHSLVGQLRGDPSLNVEQIGGELLLSPPAVQPLGWLAFLRAGWLMWHEMRRVVKTSPALFAEMKEMASIYSRDRIARLSLKEIGTELDAIGRRLEGREATFGIAGGVGQCLQTFSLLLPRWLGDDWRSLLNAALQGQGNVISAQQITRLAELADIARKDAAVSKILLEGRLETGSSRRALQGTTFLACFDRYLQDYGHRGLRESDVMSPRFAEEPEVLLHVIAAQLRGPVTTAEAIVVRQRTHRMEALATIKARCRWRVDRWVIFQWWYRRLCLFFSLREANRHHLMYYSAAARKLLLRAGELLVEQGIVDAREDVFFVTLKEREDLFAGMSQDWKTLIRARRTEREHWAVLSVPDTIRDWDAMSQELLEEAMPNVDRPLRGIPISPGLVTGSVRLVRSQADWGRVLSGDILVAPVVDPGMAPLFGIAAGLIVEMGGTLSHGSIIVREYGLPAVVNVSGAVSILSDGERITLDAHRGEILRLNAAGRSSLREAK